MGEIGERLEEVRARIAESARRVGRDPQAVRLIAVSKTKPVPLLQEAILAGATAFGENYVQELVGKREAIGGGVEWHFIGHLQTNKVRSIVPFCSLIHGVDSLRLAREIDLRAGQVGRRQAVLIEVNVAGEGTKFGVCPADVPGLAREIGELPHVALRGLMAMPPFSPDPEDSRPHFIALRTLQEKLLAGGTPPEQCGELSMGMTADYGIAIEEGATLVRVGTAIFGSRDAVT